MNMNVLDNLNVCDKIKIFVYFIFAFMYFFIAFIYFFN